MTFFKADLFLVLVVVAVIGGGCQKREKNPGAQSAARTCPCAADGGVQTRASTPDARPAPSRPTPTRRVQHFTLLAAAKGYRDHRRCVASVHASLPPELTREADSANLAERVCQSRRALAEKRPALCEEIDGPFWPQACRRLYAALYGKPDECPPRKDRSRGRDGLCLALATRDPALCRAVRSAQGRLRCAAILGSASLCRGLRTTAEVVSCQRDRKRWRAVLRPAKPGLPTRYAPKSTFVLTSPARTQRGVSTAMDLGVVVPRAGTAGRWTIGGLQSTGRPAAEKQALLLLGNLPPPGKVPATIRVGTEGTKARFCALWKGRAVLPAKIQGEVKITRYAPRRSARVAGTYNVKIVLGEATITVTGVFDTFVRDVIPGPWARSTCKDRLAEAAPSALAAKVSPAPVESGERPCFFVAHWQGQIQLGYRVYGVRPRGACRRLGLRNGDVVLAVGSVALTSWSGVVTLYALLAGTKPVTVRVQRKKKKITLKWAGS